MNTYDLSVYQNDERLGFGEIGSGFGFRPGLGLGRPGFGFGRPGFGRPGFGFGFGRSGFGFGLPFLTGVAAGSLLTPRPYPYYAPYAPYPYYPSAPFPCC